MTNITQEQILARIRAANSEAPAGAFATELQSNDDVVGNQNSKALYNQTPVTNEGMMKDASAVTSISILEKTASLLAAKKKSLSWGKRLLKNIQEAEPLTQLGLAGGAIFGVDKLKNSWENSHNHREKAQLEMESLKALRNINRTLTAAQLDPRSIKVQRPKGMN